MAASESKEKAEQLKNQANEFFKAEKYGQAIDFYSQVSHQILPDFCWCCGSGYRPDFGWIGIILADRDRHDLSFFLSIWIRIRIHFNQM
jgi:hypothetical protein